MNLREESKEGSSPTRSDEYLIYQSLVGSWPISEDGKALPASADYLERLQQYFIKAIREAKVRTSWINSDSEYESRLLQFVKALIFGKSKKMFQQAFFPLVELVAKQGAINSLAQLSLKCACPGVPDIYQGTEYWDLSLVDPDNRRPVDYSARISALQDMNRFIQPITESADRSEFVTDLLNHWPTGKIKQYIMARSLRWRGAFPELFESGAYEPMSTREHKESVLCFARRNEAYRLIVCVGIKPHATENHVRLEIPEDWNLTSLVDLYTGHGYGLQKDENGAYLDLSDSFMQLPVKWLWPLV